MDIPRSNHLDSALAKAEQARDLLINAGDQISASQIAELIEKAKNQIFVIGVIGSAKRGKSTLINGMLRQRNDNFAPIGKFPATNVVSVFGRSDRLLVRVFFQDKPSPIEISEHEVRLYVTEEHNPGNQKHVRSVEVLGPFEGLGKGVFLVDTPGADNALSSRHGELLLEFLPKADAAVFIVSAEEPLTEAERKLLKEAKEHGIRKLFFAVNKVDRIESGDLTTDELAQGIQHNRNVLESVGYRDPVLYEISAKRFHETGQDGGVDRLISDISTMIAEEKLELMARHINECTDSILDQYEEHISIQLEESRKTAQELDAERKTLEAIKRQLSNGKTNREREFSFKWNEAFDDLKDSIGGIRKELITRYTDIIDSASQTRLSALAQTIHADVQVCFAERLRPRMDSCQQRIDEALRELENPVLNLMIRHRAEITAPRGVVKTGISHGLMIVGGATPAFVTGVVSSTMPSIVSSLIASATPSAAAISINPATWLPWLGSLAGGGVIAASGAAITTTLTAFALPFAIGAFGLSAIKAFSTWREVGKMQKNELKANVINLIDDGCDQVRAELDKLQRMQSRILFEFEKKIEEHIEKKDIQLSELQKNRPSPQHLQRLEAEKAAFEHYRLLLVAPKNNSDGNTATPSLLNRFQSGK